MERLVEFHVGDIITSLSRASLIAGGKEVIMYTTLSGAIGMFIPFISKDEAEFFQTLELHLREEAPSLVGRDHASFRGYYLPPKSVVDGELCQFYTRLTPEKRREIAGEFERTAPEMLKKLEDIVTRSAF